MDSGSAGARWKGLRTKPRVSNWFAGTAIAVAVGLVLVLVLLLTGALLDSADDLVTVFLARRGGGGAGGLVAGQAGAGRAGPGRGRRARTDRPRAPRRAHARAEDARPAGAGAHRRAPVGAASCAARWRGMHKQQGTLAQTGDVRELVLQTAVQLVEAERGLLLSRRDMDNDGDFDMVCQTGFENDATHSAVAQEFAGKVLRRDETVREDDSRQLRGEGRNPADDEIHNLLAIPIFIQDDFEGVVLCANRDGGFEDLDDDVLLALGDHAGAVLENGRLQGEMRSTYMAIVRMLAEAIEAKDPATRLHSEDVAEYVRAVADGPGAGAAAARGAADRLAAARRGQDRRVRADPAQAGPADAGRARRDAAAREDRLPPGAPGARAARHRVGGAAPPRALGRRRLPRRAGRRPDPAGRARDLRGRRVQRHDIGAPVPRGHEPRGGVRRAASAAPASSSTPGWWRCSWSRYALHPPGSARRRASWRARWTTPRCSAQLEPGEPVVGYGPSGAVDNLTLLYAHRHLHEQAARLAEESELAGVPYAVLLVELSDAHRDQRARGLRGRRPRHRGGGPGGLGRGRPGARDRLPLRRAAAGRAGAGRSPARGPRRWAATWSARWRPTGPPCARPPPSGAPAIRPPRRSAAPGWHWPARPCRRRHRPSDASYRRGRCAAPSPSACCCSASTPPPSGWTRSATPSTRATSRTTCWPPSRSWTTTTST